MGRARDLVLPLMRAALEGVDAGRATTRGLAWLRAQAPALSLDGCSLLAFGKASRAMAEAALHGTAARSGLVVALDPRPLAGLEMIGASHPVPAADAEAAGRRVLTWARARGEGEVVLCLVSGGGSAMLEVPASGLAMEDLRATTALLLAAGLPIEELNAVRRRLSAIKGGGLARALAPARVVSLVLSDVPGGDPAVVASGPTCPPPVEGPDALAVVRARGLMDALPEAVRRRLLASDEALPAVGDALVHVVADNRTARDALAAEGRRLGLRVAHETGYASGEAAACGRGFVSRARERCVREGLDLVVWGGETTVQVRGRGRGGRNQEVALGAAEVVGDGLVASFGTDGVDGTSGAAGAFLDAEVVRVATAAGLSAEGSLADNDADRFFAAGGGRLATGPTGTNVADVMFYLR